MIPRKKILQKIESLTRQIEIHYEKIQDARITGQNLHIIPHWESEIENFTFQIRELRQKLHTRRH